MEFFRESKIDWMGKSKYFVALSVGNKPDDGGEVFLPTGLKWPKK